MIDIDSFWEYGDPAASEARFRAAMSDGAMGDADGQLTKDERLELVTQIARTYSLRQQFDEAHEQLNHVETELAEAGTRPTIRYWLERGRTFNSAGETERGRDCFLKAWELGQTSGQAGLAVDAAHMVAITYVGTPEAVSWAKQGLALARPSTDPKAQALIPAMLNNTAWDLHDQGQYPEALDFFQQAQSVWEARGKPRQIQIARWSVARCLRSLERHQEALDILYALETELRTQEIVDGYVFEEIGENLFALAQHDAAKPYFAMAITELEKDSWVVEHEAERLDSLRARM